MIINTMNNLPKSLKVESAYLEQMLDMKNFSASYKMLWLYAIYKEIIMGNNEVSVKKLISRMVGLVWYPIIYYKLNLGAQDKLSDIVLYVHDTLKISREENEHYVSDFIFRSDDKDLNNKVNNISLYVQYRLIRPLYENNIKTRESILGRKLTDSELHSYITDLSNTDIKPFYKIDRENKKIIFGELWAEYIRDNQAIIEGWINYKFICYLQVKNPNVPSIPFKIHQPVKRNLTKAKKYWKIIGDEIKIKDIYTDKVLEQKNFDKYGEVSIDHFIPWSFVLHDELWNLVPTFKNINSSKGNNLPDLEQYYNEFCELQYIAFTIARRSSKIPPKYLEDYFNVNRYLYSLDLNDRCSKDIFINSLRKTISPLYQIASNQGYGNWSFNII